MAEAKRNASTTNKVKKSKNEVLRSALGAYLKQRNYTSNERFRKTDVVVSQSAMDMAINTLMSGEVSRPNSFSYSNAFCLNASQVDQQFSKLSNFIQSLVSPVKNELQEMLPPLLCHLFIEMLRGRDFRPAFEFLKKYSTIIAPIDNINSSTIQHKLNGNTTSLTNDETTTQNLTNGNSQIIFLPETSCDETLTNEQNTKESFKDLIQILSTMNRIQDIDTNIIVKNFRSSKFEIKISQKSLNILKRYLAKQGHLIILQLIQVWFHIEIIECIKTSDDCVGIDDDDLLNPTEKIINEFKERSPSPKLVTDNDCQCDYGQMLHHYGILKECCDHFKKDQLPVNGCKKCNTKGNMDYPIDLKRLSKTRFFSLKSSEDALYDFDKPVRVLNVSHTDNRLCAANIDADECHMVGGFENSSINLWSLKKSIYYGKKPFGSFTERYCGWAIDSFENIDDYSSSDDDEQQQQQNQLNINVKLKLTKKEKWKRFMERGCSQNTFSETGGITLRGHGKAVTDVLFSRYNPLLYSVSRDQTMRAWKASDYTCAAIYRGHNYPIWCVAESSNGAYVATGSRDTTARLWSTDREFPLLIYVGHTQDVDTIAFHPNGSYIATGSTDLSVRLWCVTSGKLFRVFTDCKLPIQCVKFSPNGKYLAAGGEENCIRIFDLAAGTQLTELKNLSSSVTNIAWNKYNSCLAASCSDGNFHEWNINGIGIKKEPQVDVGPSTSSSTNSSSATQTETSSTPPPSITTTTTATTPTATTTTATPATTKSTNPNQIELIRTDKTSCKRLIHLKYNERNVLSLVGNS